MKRADYEAAVAGCPTPQYHGTHRYCPSCPWNETGYPLGEELDDEPRVGAGRRLVPRRFELVRDEDVTGVSGVGAVAWGCAFPDGVVALRWNTEWPSSVVWYDRGIEAVEHVHGHQGRTRIVWLDEL